MPPTPLGFFMAIFIKILCLKIITISPTFPKSHFLAIFLNHISSQLARSRCIRRLTKYKYQARGLIMRLPAECKGDPQSIGWEPTIPWMVTHHPQDGHLSFLKNLSIKSVYAKKGNIEGIFKQRTLMKVSFIVILTQRSRPQWMVNGLSLIHI